MSLRDFQILNKVGEGAHSAVYKVRRIAEGAIYALKQTPFQSLPAKEMSNAVNQVRLLASIRHPNVIAYKEAFYDQPSSSLCVVTEYADGGDLLQKIFQAKRKGNQFTQAYVWDVFMQVLRGLSLLHSMRILHRDVKSSKILLMKLGQVKLSGLDSSYVLARGTMCQSQTGTPYYASPQVWRNEGYNSRSDMWSLGCVLYEIMNLKPPFRSRTMEGLQQKVLRCYYVRPTRSYSDALAQALTQLLTLDPQARATAKQMLALAQHRTNYRKELVVEDTSLLLKTIKVTRNVKYLSNKLPQSNYSPVKFKLLHIDKLINKGINPEKSNYTNQESISYRQNSKRELSLAPLQSKVALSPQIHPKVALSSPVLKPLSKSSILQSNAKIMLREYPILNKSSR